METLIKWNEGDGNIVAVYNGSGDGTITFSSDVANEGIDRSQEVQVTNDNINVSVIVNQIGLREIFNTADGFTLADGGTFNVLKNEF